jgi:hypothetical protein
MMNFMRYPLRLLLPVALIWATAHAADTPPPAAAATPASAATPAPAPAPVPVTGNLDLFNGKNMDGWNLITTPTADVSKICQVKDGVMSVNDDRGPKGYLEIPVLRDKYRLHFEWRWTTNNPKNNSGALLHITGGPVQQVWPTCFQIQTKTQRAGDVIPMGTAKCAELPPPPATQVDRKADASEKPIGEWNAADVTVNGDVIECTVNGVVQNKVTHCTPSSGNIGFQLEGYPYEMRNIRLLPFEPDKPAVAAAK